MLDIDGSLYAGSGSIVRRSVAYAALTGQPIRVRNARARRRHPGLRPQHRRAIEAVPELVGGSLEDVAVGSRSFVCRPGDATPSGRYVWDIGTSGSTTMPAPAVLPVCALRRRGVEIERDDRIDQLDRDMVGHVLAHRDDPERLGRALRMLPVSRSLERAGDHAMDIAEQA